MSKENDDMDLLYYAAPATIVAALIIYFFEVWLPNFLDTKKDVDLEEAKAVAKKTKEDTEATIAKVTADSEKVAELTKVIDDESTKDKAETAQAVEEAKEDVEGFLRKEGMHVEEIFPED